MPCSRTGSTPSTRCRASITTICSTRSTRPANRIRVVHTRHEQGAPIWRWAPRSRPASRRPIPWCPGPGLLNSGAALLTAYSMNAPVLALIGQIPQSAIGRDLGHLHEIRDQAGIIARLVDHSARIPRAAEAPRMVAEAIQSMFTDRPGPGRARMRHGRLGPRRAGRGPSRRSPVSSRRSTTMPCARRRSCSAPRRIR